MIKINTVTVKLLVQPPKKLSNMIRNLVTKTYPISIFQYLFQTRKLEKIHTDSKKSTNS